MLHYFYSFQLRPPQPAVYLFVLDVSHNAVEAGYLTILCQSLLENLDKSQTSQSLGSQSLTVPIC